MKNFNLLLICLCSYLVCLVGADTPDADKYYTCDGTNHIYISPERVVSYESFSKGVEGFTIKSWEETDNQITIKVSAVVNADQSFICTKSDSTVKCGLSSSTTKVDYKTTVANKMKSLTASIQKGVETFINSNTRRELNEEVEKSLTPKSVKAHTANTPFIAMFEIFEKRSNPDTSSAEKQIPSIKAGFLTDTYYLDQEVGLNSIYYVYYNIKSHSENWQTLTVEFDEEKSGMVWINPRDLSCCKSTVKDHFYTYKEIPTNVEVNCEYNKREREFAFKDYISLKTIDVYESGSDITINLPDVSRRENVGATATTIDEINRVRKIIDDYGKRSIDSTKGIYGYYPRVSTNGDYDSSYYYIGRDSYIIEQYLSNEKGFSLRLYSGKDKKLVDDSDGLYSILSIDKYNKVFGFTTEEKKGKSYCCMTDDDNYLPPYIPYHLCYETELVDKSSGGTKMISASKSLSETVNNIIDNGVVPSDDPVKPTGDNSIIVCCSLMILTLSIMLLL